MMPILVKSDDVRSGRKGKAHHGRLRVAQESMGIKAQRVKLFVLFLKALKCSDSSV